MIHGTPAPMTQTVGAAASSAYSEAISRAQEHYSHAQSIVSARITGEPKPVHKEMFASVESVYSAALDAASGHLQDALNVASTKVSGSPQQQMVSAANAQYSNAMAAASSQLESARTAVGVTSTPGYEKFTSDASSRYYSII